MHFIRFKGNEVFMESQLCKLFDLSMEELNGILHNNKNFFEEGCHYFKLEDKELQDFNEVVAHDSLSSTIYVWSLDAIPLLTRVIRSQSDKVYSNKKDMKDRNTSNSKFKTIDVNGETYVFKTYPELCEKVGIPYSTFMRRREKGLSVEDALYNGSLVALKPVIFKGEYYESKAELCRRYNVRYKTFLMRQYMEFTLEECVFGKKVVSKPKPKKEEKAVETIHFKGVDYKNYEELARAYGVSVFALLRKIQVDKLTLEESIQNVKEEKLIETVKVEPLTEKEIKKDVIESIEYNGKKYTSARELSADSGIAISTLKIYLKRGYSVKEIQNKVKEVKTRRGKP